MSIRNPVLFMVAVLAAAPGNDARGDDKLVLPKSPPPVFGIARLNKAGKIELDQTVTTFVIEKRARVVVRDGKRVPEEYSVYRQVFQTVTSQLEIKDVETFLSPDKKLAAEDLRDELAKPRAAVMTTDGRKLDPFFVALLKPGTLIIVNRRMKLLLPVLTPVRPLPGSVKQFPRKAP